MYSYLSNKRGGEAKIARSLNTEAGINVEVGINVEGGIFCKKNYLLQNCNKRGVKTEG